MQHHTALTHRPPRRTPRRTLAALAGLVATLAVVLGVGTPAAGGGWALGSLDVLPDARAGQTEQVGFMILQHGITPRHFDDAVSGDVGIEIVAANGEIEFFEAVPATKVGHYVADVTFPAAGDYTWSIRMGWFPPQDLGALTVTAESGSSFSGGESWNTVRWGLLGVVGLLAAIAVVDPLARRRRTAPAAP